MKIKTPFALLGAIALLALTTVSDAQGGGGQGRGQGRGGMFGRGGTQPSWMLLSRTDVQDDLKITSEQKDKLSAMRDEMQETMRARFQGGQGGGERPDREAMQKMMEETMKVADDKIKAILTPEQTKRLGEISIQMGGMAVVNRADIAKELGITADQKTKLDALQDGMRKAQQSLGEKVRNGEMDRETMQATREKNTEIMNVEIGKILTTAQKDKLKAMSGAPFTRKDE